MVEEFFLRLFFNKYCTDFDDETQSALCLANRNINVNDQVTIFYGRRNNTDLLIHNGFVPDSKNSFDSFILKLGISPQDALYQKKCLVLKKFMLER